MKGIKIRRPGIVEKFMDRGIIREIIDILDSDEFFARFNEDLKDAGDQVLIFSPFVAKEHRFPKIKEMLKEVVERGAKVKLITLPIEIVKKRHSKSEKVVKQCLRELKEAGVEIYGRDSHIKAAIIDDKVLYIGSLNILSQWDKPDVMVRISGPTRLGIIPKLISGRAKEKIRPPKEEEKLVLEDGAIHNKLKGREK